MVWPDRETQLSQMAPDTPRSMAPRAHVPSDLRQLDDATPYVELHLHSCFSMLSGASHIEELAETAQLLGYHALALTDSNGLYGAMEFAQELKARGIQSITGLELSVAEEDDPESPRAHLTLLAETRAGYRNLCRMISFAHGLLLDEPAAKDARRKEPWIHAAALRDHHEGLIVLTGCRQGRIPALVAEERLPEACAALEELVRWFGRDQVFVELQDNLVYGDSGRNRALVQLAERVGVGVVGTGNVHYHVRERHRLQDVMTATRHRKTLEQSHRERRPNDEFYLRPPAEQAERFAAYHPEAARNSVRIAQRCQFDLTEDLGYTLPSPQMSTGQTPDERLREVCETALRGKYTAIEQPRATARLNEELRLISKHGLSGFFLIYQEVFELAEEVAIEVRGKESARGKANLPVGRGRGSSVSSIACYLIGLSHIDPLKSNLFLGRFLNEELYSLPDIDLDFPRDIRERLIERVYERWGKDHAALVAAFPTYRLRSAVRDVGKALGLPLVELSRFSRLATQHHTAADMRSEFERYPEFANRVDAPGWRDLVELVSQLSRMPRHASEHVGGMVIASEPLIDCVPCQPAAWEGRYVCQWDKDSIDDARMVKIDFLALGMLSAVEESIELIAEEQGRTLDLSRIDFADSDVYDDICNGDTVGIFQIESRAQIAMLPRSQPRNIDDLAVQVAIVRPGPIVGGAVNPYVNRRVKLRENPGYVVEMPHPDLRDVLGETLGVVIFQEQVLQVAEIMGNFGAGEAEAFRRAMSRKRSAEIMESYRAKFLAGSRANGVSEAVATRVFENLKGFAEFGFPKSHSVSFALLAYQTAWMKRYYPVEFFCGLFNNQPMGFYPPHVLTNDAKRHGISVVRPDINISRVTCSVEQDAHEQLEHGGVRVGLGYVRQVGEAGAAVIAAERERGGEFQSLFDFVQRTGLARRATESLIRIGAFDTFGMNRRELLWQLGLFGDGLVRSNLRIPKQRQLQLQLSTQQDAVPLANFTAYQRMAADYELLGLSPDSHPMTFLRPALGEGVQSSRHLQSLPGNSRVSVAGLVVCRQRPQTARGVVFLLLEDEFGMVNVMVSKEMDEEQAILVRTAMFLEVEGVAEKRAGEQRTIVATALREIIPTEALLTPEGKNWG